MGNFNRVDTTANRMRIAMYEAGKKQADIVKETGINRSAISRYLSGEYEPKQDAIHKIAKCLGVSEMWLWGYECSMERPPEQRNNDAISDIVIKLRKDEDFLSATKILYDLTPEQMTSVKNLLAAFKK